MCVEVVLLLQLCVVIYWKSKGHLQRKQVAEIKIYAKSENRVYWLFVDSETMTLSKALLLCVQAKASTIREAVGRWVSGRNSSSSPGSC